MLTGLDTWSSVADLRDGEHEDRASPILLGLLKNNISAEHHLKVAYEQGISLENAENGHYRYSNFQTFLGEHAPRLPQKSLRLWRSGSSSHPFKIFLLSLVCNI